MKRTIVVSCLLLGICCLSLQAQNASVPKPLWNVGQLPGDSRNVTLSYVPGHTASGSGRSLSVTATDTGWIGEWCGKAVNWSGFKRLAFTVSNSNDFDVSVYARVKTVAGALGTFPLDLPPGLSTPVVKLADLKDESGQPLDLSQIRQWSLNWNDAFEKPIYISELRVESNAPAPKPAEAHKPAETVQAITAALQADEVAETVQDSSGKLLQADELGPPPAPDRASRRPGINWSAVLCVMMVCVTAIIIVRMLRPKKA